MASTTLPAALNFCRTSGVASATATRAAARATRLLRSFNAGRTRDARLGSHIMAAGLDSCCQTNRRDDAPRFDYLSRAEYEQIPDDAKIPTDKDLESDEATWALYWRWCKAFRKERDHADHADIARRFKLFRYYAKEVHFWNTHLPPDPKEADKYNRKRKQVQALLSKGQDVSHFDEQYVPMELGPFADGGDPFLTEIDKLLLISIEKKESVQDATAH
ncbi:hypothetical protein ACUV84_037692 [Puccinellia chinampoensis]